VTKTTSKQITVFKKHGKYGLANELGKEILPAQYDHIGHFYDELAVIKMNGKYGVINKSGKLVVRTIYDEIYRYGLSGRAPARTGRKWGALDTMGKVVIPFKYDFVTGYDLIKNIWNYNLNKNGTIGPKHISIRDFINKTILGSVIANILVILGIALFFITSLTSSVFSETCPIWYIASTLAIPLLFNIIFLLFVQPHYHYDDIKEGYYTWLLGATPLYTLTIHFILHFIFGTLLYQSFEIISLDVFRSIASIYEIVLTIALIAVNSHTTFFTLNPRAKKH
jgi:hypothetical protein